MKITKLAKINGEFNQLLNQQKEELNTYREKINQINIELENINEQLVEIEHDHTNSDDSTSTYSRLTEQKNNLIHTRTLSEKRIEKIKSTNLINENQFYSNMDEILDSIEEYNLTQNKKIADLKSQIEKLEDDKATARLEANQLLRTLQLKLYMPADEKIADYDNRLLIKENDGKTTVRKIKLV